MFQTIISRHNSHFFSDKLVLFFFSSRRRHTSWNCDWSSDVCSSDLRPHAHTAVHRSAGQRGVNGKGVEVFKDLCRELAGQILEDLNALAIHTPLTGAAVYRSEERRVGKDCRSGGAADSSAQRQGGRE